MTSETGKFDQIVATEVIRREVASAEQQTYDAVQARELVKKALDPSSPEYRVHGPDRLLGAALVYATLASGGS